LEGEWEGEIGGDPEEEREIEMLSLPDTPPELEGEWEGVIGGEFEMEFEVETAGDCEATAGETEMEFEVETAGDCEAIPGELEALRPAPGDGEAGILSKGLASTTR
jgi:hypothetical protein